MKVHELTAAGAAEEMAHDRLSAEELAASCLEQIDAREGEVGAWAFLDRKQVIEQARQADRRRTGPEGVIQIDGDERVAGQTQGPCQKRLPHILPAGCALGKWGRVKRW